jgi:hypothetical protein
MSKSVHKEIIYKEIDTKGGYSAPAGVIFYFSWTEKWRVRNKLTARVSLYFRLMTVVLNVNTTYSLINCLQNLVSGSEIKVSDPFLMWHIYEIIIYI